MHYINRPIVSIAQKCYWKIERYNFCNVKNSLDYCVKLMKRCKHRLTQAIIGGTIYDYSGVPGTHMGIWNRVRKLMNLGTASVYTFLETVTH